MTSGVGWAAEPPRSRTSAISARASGCPCVEAMTSGRVAASRRRTWRNARHSSALRLSSRMARRSVDHPGSVRHAVDGGRWPATTTRTSAASTVRRWSRNQASTSSPSDSYVSRRTTATAPEASRAGASAAERASGTGGASRTSTTSAARPASAARSANLRSRVDLPTPAGPCTKRTDTSGSGSRIHEAKKASSSPRPTKAARRASANRSPKVFPIAPPREPRPGRRHAPAGACRRQQGGHMPRSRRRRRRDLGTGSLGARTRRPSAARA